MTQSIFALDKFDFVFFDTETTGLSPSQGHRVITASVHRTDSSFQSLFSHTVRSNPGRPSDQGALAVHKISNEQAASFPPFTIQDADVLAQRDREPAIWAAHKADFDLNFLANEFSVVGAQPPRAAAFVDTVSIAKKLWPGKSAKLQDIYERTVAAAPQGITFHSSDDDTGALRDVFQVMKGEMQQRGMWNMEGLASTQPYGVFLSWPKQVQQSVFSNVNRSFAQTEGFDGGYIGASGVSGFVFGASNQPPSAPFVPQFTGDDEDDPSSYASPIVPSASLWTQGSVPRPFDLPLRDRRAFSAATNAYVARANDFFHRQGIDITVPSTSETGYKPAMASWGSTQTPRGAPLSTTAFRVGTWGYHTSNPLPTFGGNIITPVLQIDDSSGIWQAKTLQPHEVIGRALVEGRGAAQRHINKYYDPKMDSKAFESLVQRGERVGAAAVRSGIGMFATATWAERYTATPGYTSAMQSSYQLESIGKYGILPRDLFNIIGQHGYFTRKPYASKDIENPERSTWAMYHVSSLGSSGWLYNPNIGEHGTFRTDVGLDKLPKRRQLMVQTAAVPEVDERLFNRIRRSRLSQDRSGAKAMYANALFVDNYPLSEGTAAIHPDAAPIGFRKMQHQFVERPRDAKAWSVDWNLQKSTQPGQALFLGTQLVNGREMPLQTIKGIRGVRQELWGVREIDEKGRQGFELAIGEHHPAESGGFKIFHSGVKALMMKSRSIVEGFRRSTGREFDVVAPLPKSWQLLQYGMIDYLPQKDLLGLLGEGGMDREEANRLIMGVRSNPKEQYQYLGPLQDALTKAIRGRRFEFEHTLQMDKRNIEAFRMAGSLVGEKDLGGDRVAATVKMTGYNLPMPLQYRQEFPGKKPFYSPEELKRLGARLQNVPSHMRDQAEIELIRLRKGSAASRVFGAAQAMDKGYDPRRSMSYEDMDWIDIGAKAINIPGSDDEPILQAIEAQMKERKALYITGPGGVVFPRPSDVKRMGALNLQGREMSTLVTSYVRAVTSLGNVSGDVPTQIAEFGEQLTKMGSYSNVRRHAMGKIMERSVEGPYVGHVGIPDEYMVAGDDALMRLGGLRSREQLAGFKQEIEEQGFYAALSRRPQSSPTMQFETMLRVVSPEFAKKEWDVDIEDLGRNFALSTTTAGVQRGDFDADRAIARALTRKTKSGELFTPDYYDFKKNDQRRQILTALQQQAPQDYAAYRATLTPEQTAQLDSALAGNLKDSMAIVRATYGIGYVTKPTDAKWNELAKWTESLQANKLHSDNPTNSADFWKSVKGPLLVKEMYTYTGAQVIDAFRRKHVEPKSQMGPVYNQYIRGLAALAIGPVEQAAAEAFGAITYQDTIDMEPMKQSVATILDMTYYLGKSGSMHRHYSTPMAGEGDFRKITTDSGAILGALLEQFKQLPVSRDMQAVLFSRDPQIQAWYKQGNFAQITREISRRGAGNYMVDPNQAGPLVQLVRSQQLAKSSWSGMQKTTMEEAAMRTGEGLGAYRGVYSKTAIKAGDVTDKLRAMVDRPEEARFMRSMLAMRTGAHSRFFRSDEELLDELSGVASFANKALPGEEFPAFISGKEADVLEGLRQMPAHQAQQVAAMVSKPARYTPKGGAQSFSTAASNRWDDIDMSKLSAAQQQDILNLMRTGALDKAVKARYQEMIGQGTVSPVEQTILRGAHERTLDKMVAGVVNTSGIPGQESAQMRAGIQTDEFGVDYYPEWRTENPAAWRNYVQLSGMIQEQAQAPIRAARLNREQRIRTAKNQWQQQGDALVPAAHIGEVLPNLAWQPGHQIWASTKNQGATWLFKSVEDRSAWQVAHRDTLTQAFERAVTKDFRETDDQEVYMESQGKVYNDWTTVANRPSEAQISQMPLARQITTRQNIVKATLGAAQKMGLSNAQFSQMMPESYKLMERQIEALTQSREATHDLVQTMEKMRDAVGKNTEIQGKLAEVFQPGSAGFKQAVSVLGDAYRTSKDGGQLTPEQINQLSSASRVFAYTGKAAHFKTAYEILQGETARAVEAEELEIMRSGKSGKRGFAGTVQKMFGSEGGGPAGGLFEDVAFGWTAFRLRMVMGLTTGAQAGWRDQFYGEQSAMANAALLLGATPAQGGSLSQYITAQNQIANMRANLGYGSAQVVGGFSSALAGLNLGAGVGSAATIGGYGAAATMGAGIIAASLGKVFPSVAAAAGPIGVAAGLTTAGVLGMSYAMGQAPEYLRYGEDTWPRIWRQGVREFQIEMNQGNAQQILAAEQAQWNQPNYLPRVMTELEEFVGTKWPTAEKGPAADLLSRIAQMTGIQADSLTKRGGDKTVAIADKLMDYVIAGADVSSIYNSMMGAVNLAGVPLGTPATDWMLNYLDTVPKEQRAIYEQYLGALGPYRQATGRPLDIGMVPQIRGIAETRGVTPEQASQYFMMRQGYGDAARQYGLMAGSPQAIAIGLSEEQFSPEALDQQNTWRGTLLQTLRSGGLRYDQAQGAITGLRRMAPDKLQEIAEISILARNVVVQTGRGAIGDATSGYIGQMISAGALYTMTPAQRQAYGQRMGGLGGLAPSTMVQGGTQATEFELGLSRQSDLVAYQNAAAQILQQTRPSGYSQQQLDLVAGRLYRGESINTVSSDLLATSGRMGIGASMGFGMGTGASAAIDVQARSTAQFLGGQGTVSERASYLASFVANPQYLTGSRAAAALIPGSPAAIAYQKVDSGQWSPYQGGLMAQLSDKYNPLGYTANLAYEQGTFSEFLAGGVPAGGLQDIYGRQPGAERMFAAQQAAGWSSYRLSAAQEQVRQARFGRQINEWRQEWGSGPYVSTSQVIGARRAEYKTWEASIASMSPEDAKVAREQGFQFSGDVGSSQVGLVQQEAAIRRQMWQENLNYQRQSFAFAQQQLQIQREQLALSRQQYDVQREYQLGERDAGRGMQLLQRQWTQEDWAIQGERVGITNQWAQEDVARAIRYSTGRERIQLMRQRDRMTLQQGWEQEDRSRNQDRQRQQWRYEDDRYSKAVEYEQKLHAIQMQRFALQERALDLQGSQLAAQMAHAEKMAAFEAELQKIEDERFKTNYENMQKQIEEELKLEPLRKDAIAADLAYQATRLENAQLIWDAEKKYMEWLKQMIIDVAAEWVKLRSAQAGQSSPSTEANKCPVCGQTFATPQELSAHITTTGHNSNSGRAPVRSAGSPSETLLGYTGNAGSGQPVTVNFILDGEVIMSTVVTPERLRPVVQEISQRNGRRQYVHTWVT